MYRSGMVSPTALVIVALSLLTVGLVPSPAGAQAEPDCTAPQNTVEMHYCADQAYQAADADLNHVWRSMRGHLSKDEKALLLKAQRAWLKFRDANCDFAASPYLGGSIHPVILLTCLETMTRERTEELRAMLEQN